MLSKKICIFKIWGQRYLSYFKSFLSHCTDFSLFLCSWSRNQPDHGTQTRGIGVGIGLCTGTAQRTPTARGGEGEWRLVEPMRNQRRRAREYGKRVVQIRGWQRGWRRLATTTRYLFDRILLNPGLYLLVHLIFDQLIPSNVYPAGFLV